MKKYVSCIFLLLVMNIQLLPVAQISAAVFQSQQMTEEVPLSDDPVTPSLSEEIHTHFVTVSYEELIHLTALKFTELIHHAEKMYTRHADDVQTRPPNT